MENKSQKNLIIVVALLITSYLTANIMAVKLVEINGIAFFDAGTITFPLAYILGDVLAEIWGFKTSRRVIILTFICNIMLVIATSIGLFLPSPDYNIEVTNAYSVIFSYVPRILVASLAAFLVGELSNAWLLTVIKRHTGENHLWLRTIGSSTLGYAADTVIFVLIAFAGVAPTEDILAMIAIQYVLKLVIEIAATPVTYIVINFIKKDNSTISKENNGKI